MQPLLRLIAQRPELLVDHARAYAELMVSQTGQACVDWRRQALLVVAGLGLIGLAAGLAGVALMLLAMLPAASGQATWVLWAVPLVALVAGLACLGLARRCAQRDAFAALREQMLADLSMLRESGLA